MIRWFTQTRATTIVAMLMLPAFSTFAADPWIVFDGQKGPGRDGLGKGKSIVFVSGDEEYRSEESLPMLAKILAKNDGFKCTVVFEIDPKTGDIDVNQHSNIPGLEALDSADLMVILTRFRAPVSEQMKHIDDYVKAGKPIVGLRTATHAFAGLKDEYEKYNYNSKASGWEKGFGGHILGETWVSHHGSHKHESTRGVIPDAVKDNPILRGVTDIWCSTDVYGINKLPENSLVLLQGQVLKGMDPKDPPVEGKKNDPMMPIAWTRTYEAESGKQGRVFNTTMGASMDLVNESIRRMVVNACVWAIGAEDNITGREDVSIIGRYEPKMYGFIKEYPKGNKPQNYIAGAENLVP